MWPALTPYWSSPGTSRTSHTLKARKVTACTAAPPESNPDQNGTGHTLIPVEACIASPSKVGLDELIHHCSCPLRPLLHGSGLAGLVVTVVLTPTQQPSFRRLINMLSIPGCRANQICRSLLVAQKQMHKRNNLSKAAVPIYKDFTHLLVALPLEIAE